MPAQDAPGRPLRRGPASGAASRVNGARSLRSTVIARRCKVWLGEVQAGATRRAWVSSAPATR
jgi:hypothetical protein